MESQHHLSIASDSLSEKDAKRILRRMCKTISQTYKTTVKLNCYSDGVVNIVSDDREIVSISVHDGKHSVASLYFDDAIDLMATLMIPTATMRFSPLGKDTIKIDTSKMFGTTLEEVKMNLDLMKIQC